MADNPADGNIPVVDRNKSLNGYGLDVVWAQVINQVSQRATPTYVDSSIGKVSPFYYNLSDVPGEIPGKDFYMVNRAAGGQYDTVNKTIRFDIPNVRDGTYINVPPIWGNDPTISRVAGFREIVNLNSEFDNANIFLKMTETYPVRGRIHMSYLYTLSNGYTVWTPWIYTMNGEEIKSYVNDAITTALGSIESALSEV